MWYFQALAEQFYNLDNNYLSILYNIENFFGLWFMIYFSTTYFLSTKYWLKKKYDRISFKLDLIDNLIIVLAFFNLGFISEKAALNLNYVHLVISLIAIIAAGSNYYMKKNIKWSLTLSIIPISSIMFFVSNEIEIINWISLAFYFFILKIYCNEYSSGQKLIKD